GIHRRGNILFGRFYKGVHYKEIDSSMARFGSTITKFFPKRMIIFLEPLVHGFPAMTFRCTFYMDALGVVIKVRKSLGALNFKAQGVGVGIVYVMGNYDGLPIGGL